MKLRFQNTEKKIIKLKSFLLNYTFFLFILTALPLTKSKQNEKSIFISTDVELT